MSQPSDSSEGVVPPGAAGADLETRIQARAAACGIELSDAAGCALAAHARAVLGAGAELHLTSITDPEEFLERHLGEAFEGAALLEPQVEGLLLDLGSGNGYPGIPLAAARRGLRLLLAEASVRRAGFLSAVLQEAGLPRARVLERHVQRPGDLDGVGPLHVLASRAMGGWAKILPRLASCMGKEGQILVWCGEEMERISKRVAWQRFEAVGRKALPCRERSWIWQFRVR